MPQFRHKVDNKETLNICMLLVLLLGKYIYCIGEDGVLYIFNTASGELENVLPISDREVIGVAHHPHRNLLATITDNGELKLWKP